MWRIVTALTVCTALSLVTNAAQNNANARWFHISPLQLGATNTFQFLVLSVGMHLYKTHLLNVSWRKTFAAGVVGMQVFNLIYLLTVYTDWAKNGWWVACTSVSVQLAGRIHVLHLGADRPRDYDPGLRGAHLRRAHLVHQRRAEHYQRRQQLAAQRVAVEHRQRRALDADARSTTPAAPAPRAQMCRST